MVDEPIIIWNTRDPLAGRSQVQFEREVKGMLTGRVEAAYIFGSYGTKEFGRNSDVDMVLVARTDKPFVERALDFTDIIDVVPDMDLLVYTPEEFERLTTNPSPGFWTSVVASMRRVV
jgi:predicted nucleotidyltransferase